MRRGQAAFGLAIALAWAPGALARDAETRVASVVLVDALPPSPGLHDRLARIRERIQDALRYPPARDLETCGSSGHWVLDRAAERAVREAAPLPYVWGRLEVPVHFDLARRGG
jgi:hypothetical protein